MLSIIAIYVVSILYTLQFRPHSKDASWVTVIGGTLIVFCLSPFLMCIGLYTAYKRQLTEG